MDEKDQPEGSEQPTEEILEQGDLPTKQVEAPAEVKSQEKQELPKNLVKEPQKIGAAKPSRLTKIKSFWLECKRVLRVTKKPDRREFMTIVKISAMGMGVIGMIGFLIHLVKELLF